MAKPKLKFEFDEASFKQASAILDQADSLVRGKAIDQTMRAVGSLIKRETVAVLPKPGYPGDKPDLRPLRETLKVKIRNYRDGGIKVMIIGFEHPAGSHGHLVEFGFSHTSGKQVPGSEYLTSTVESTRDRQSHMLISGARAALAKARVR